MQVTPAPSFLERSAQAGTWTMDVATRDTFWSPGALAIHGFAVDSPMPDADAIQSRYTAESREIIRDAVIRAIEHGEGCNLDLEVELPDGTRRFINSVVEVRRTNGKVTELAGVVIDVHERKLAELRLLESERRLRTMFMSSVQFMGLIGADGTVLEVNESSAAFHAHPDISPLGQRIWDTWWWSHSGDLQARIHDAVERAAAGEFIRLEAEIRAESDQFATIDLAIRPVLDADGKIRVLMVEGRDISERKKAEQAVRRNEERFRLMFENAPIGMALVDVDGRFKAVNRAMCDITGYSRLEMLAGLTFQKLTHRDDLPKDLSNVRRLLSGALDQYRMEKRYIHKSGRDVHVQLDVCLMRDERGEPQHFVAQVQDIGPRRHFEDALFEEKELAQVTLASIGDGVMRTDAEGRITLCNPAAARLLGLPVHAVLGRSFRSLVRLYSAHTGMRVPCPVAEVMRTGREATLPSNTELDTPDRGRVRVEDSVAPVRGLDGGLLGVVFVFHEALIAVASVRSVPGVTLPAPITAAADGRPDWAAMVRNAIDNGKIELFAQRIVSLTPGNAPSYELLMRMRDQDRLIAPGDFLPAAQKSGLSGELDIHVVRQALIQVEQMERTGPDRFSYVTINLASGCLQNAAFADEVIAELHRRKVGAGRVRFEISEVAALTHFAEAQIFIARLREAGCKVLIDHFGGAGGSPEYLQWLGADGLKIDRSRLAGLLLDDAGRAQVASIGRIGRELGMDVIAEGVEDAKLVRILGDLGVSHAQGYVFHKEEPVANAVA